jgi:hypothetical protein
MDFLESLNGTFWYIKPLHIYQFVPAAEKVNITTGSA